MSDHNSPLDQLLNKARVLANQRDGEALVFLGSVQDPIPRLLIEDQDVPATAFRIWAHLRSCVDDPNSPGMVPSYRQIMHTLGIGGKETLRNSFYVLRMTRWIT